jgi:hypothetical protein
MKSSKFVPLLTLALAILCFRSTALVNAAEIRGNCANNFTLAPTEDPNTFTLSHPGVAQVSLIGNCTYNGTGSATFTTNPSKPIILTGKWRFTSADGLTTLDVEADGVGTPDPSNPNFVNLVYSLKFVGGTGALAGVHGKGELHAVAMLTSANGGATTFTFTGQVSTHSPR